MSSTKKPERFSPSWFAQADAKTAGEAARRISAVVDSVEREKRVGRGLDLTISDADALRRAEAILRRLEVKFTARAQIAEGA